MSRYRPALVAQFDARLTGDQEIVGSTPAGTATFFSGDLIMKYFSTIILSLMLIQEGQLSVSGERISTVKNTFLFFKTKNSLNDDSFSCCNDRIGKMLHNIYISAMAISLS